MNVDPRFVEQGSSAWMALRTGRVTASRLNDLMAKLKGGGDGAKRIEYMAEKIAERVLGEVGHHFVTPAMQRGTELEPIARAAYEAKTGELVDLCGSFIHPRIPEFLASPDGLVRTDGIIEIKTVAARERFIDIVVHKDYDGYRNQIQGLLACTGRAYCDLIVFDDRFGDRGLHIARIERDEERIAVIEDAVRAFLKELAELYAQAELALTGELT